MGQLGSKITVEQNLRVCEFNGEYCYFHCWGQYSKVVEASLVRGGAPGGQISTAYAIIERPSGEVTSVMPSRIRFVDEAHDALRVMNEARKKGGPNAFLETQEKEKDGS